MSNSLFALFFAMVLCVGSFIFVAKMLTFTLFVFLQVLAGAICSPFVIFCRSAFPFHCFGGFCLLFFCVLFSFCAYGWHFDVFLTIFVESFFFSICGLRLSYLRVLVLLFRFAFPFLFLLFYFFNALNISLAPLTSILFLPLILSSRHNHGCQHVIFFLPWHTSKNMSCLPIWGSFCLVLVAPHEHTPHCTHAHPLSPTCTHFWVFLTKPTKHHVRRNFPDHRTQILTCETLNAPWLPCFCAPPCACTPSRPFTPIHTNFNLFAPVFTLNYIYICII